jgi:hypothetical protein
MHDIKQCLMIEERTIRRLHADPLDVFEHWILKNCIFKKFQISQQRILVRKLGVLLFSPPRFKSPPEACCPHGLSRLHKHAVSCIGARCMSWMNLVEDIPLNRGILDEGSLL